MRIRTGHGPDDWSENVPSHAYTGHHSGALVVGMSGTNPGRSPREANMEAARKRRNLTVVLERPPKPVCGAAMRWGDSCARRPDHKPGAHASRMAMDNRARTRRTQVAA